MPSAQEAFACSTSATGTYITSRRCVIPSSPAAGVPSSSRIPAVRPCHPLVPSRTMPLGEALPPPGGGTQPDRKDSHAA